MSDVISGADVTVTSICWSSS